MSNISIRVKLPEAPEEYVVKEERIILWDRVLQVVFIAVIALAAIYFAFHFWHLRSGDDQQTDVLQQATASLENAVQTSDQPPKTQQTFDALPEKTMASTKVNLEQGAPAVAPKPMPVEALVQRDVESPKSAEVEFKQAQVTPVGDRGSVAQPALQKVITHPTVTKAVSKIIPAQVDVLSSAVKRAVITREMNNRKPGTELPQTVLVKDGKLLTVYFYTEFEGLEKQTLYYDWYQNDKRRARVKIRPLEENIGNYSSKYITHRMTGLWRVEVSTASGEALARSEFTVVN